MNDSDPQEGIFSDLEEISHKEVKLLSNKIIVVINQILHNEILHPVFLM